MKNKNRSCNRLDTRRILALPNVSVALCIMWFLIALHARAALEVTTTAARTRGRKTVISLGLTNTFPEKVESARATVFLLNENGKVVGQGTKWIIGGNGQTTGLEPNSGTTYHFVLDAEGDFATNRVILNRVIMQGGKVVPFSVLSKEGQPGIGEKKQP